MEKRVFIFLDTMPQRQGSGASLRFYSNVRAYLDLGFAVEVIQVANSPDGSEPSNDLEPVTWSRVIEPPASPTLLGRMLFRRAIPNRFSLDYYFPQRRIAHREALIRIKDWPEAIYHFEGEALSTVIPWLPKNTRAIWSLHDLASTVSEATIKVACEAEGRTQTIPEQRQLRFSRSMERYMSQRVPLILGISTRDCDLLRTEWGCKRVEYLPMSIPGDGRNDFRREWMASGHLRLLHLGRVSHLPSYRSLEFLFEKIFPILPSRTLEKILLNVVGRVDQDERARRILSLASRYNNVQFHGFVDDVVPYYQNNDVQVVAATDATGLRTRTIESFAYGLPVLSTAIGARGIGGLRAGEDLLIANTAEEFAQHLTMLVQSEDTLSRLSNSGRIFYETNQSRKVVAAKLSQYLEQYL